MDQELEHVLRKHNRTLRKVNSALRKALKESIEYSDNLFIELCDKKSLDFNPHTESDEGRISPDRD